MAHSEVESFRGLAFAQARTAVRRGTATTEQKRIYEMHQIGHQTARVGKENGNNRTAKVMLEEVHEIGIQGWRCRSCHKMNRDGKAGEVKCFHCSSRFKFVVS